MTAQLVSILMPTLNQAEFIAAAIQSVLSQSCENLELIIMDGGSSDATASIVDELAAQDTRIRFYSQADSGPAQALNRALMQARGTVIGWLNSDDLYVEGAVGSALAFLDTNPDVLMVYGDGEHVDKAGVPFERYPTLPANTPISAFSQGCFICQPTVFFRRTMTLLLGQFDESLKCSFDFEYWLRAFKAFPDRIGYLNRVQAQTRFYEGTITMKQRRSVALEGVQVLHRHLGEAPKEWLLTYANELLANPEIKAGAGNLEEHFDKFLQEASVWITPQELALARSQISKLLLTHQT